MIASKLLPGSQESLAAEADSGNQSQGPPAGSSQRGPGCKDAGHVSQNQQKRPFARLLRAIY